MDVPAADFYVHGVLAKPAAAAFAAGRPSAEAAEHIFILYLVAVLLHPLEELADSDYGIFIAFDVTGIPEDVFLLCRELAIGSEYRDAIAVGAADKLLLEPNHLVALPAGDCPVINGFCLVGDHQILAYAYDFPQPAAYRTGTEGAVETEHVFVGHAEGHSVGLEGCRETFPGTVLTGHVKSSATCRKRMVYGGVQTGFQVIVGAFGTHPHSVN